MGIARRSLSLAAVAAAALVLAGCAGSSDPASTEATDTTADLKSYDFTISTASVPEDHHTMAMVRFAELIEEKSDGRLTATVHDSASLMDQNSEQDAVRRGSVDMVYSGPQWVQELVPEAGLLTVPYLFCSVDHLYDTYDGEVGEQIFDLVAERTGARPLYSQYLGTRQLMLKDVGTINTPADLAGVKLRVPDAQSWIDMGNALGANPTPVSFSELYLALQTGTVDGQDNPLPSSILNGFDEVTSQVVLTSHVINDVWFTINEDLWQSLDDEAKQIIEDSFAEARDYATDIVLDRESEAVATLEERGLKVYEPNVEAFREHVLAFYLDDDARTATWVDGMADEILSACG